VSITTYVFILKKHLNQRIIAFYKRKGENKQLKQLQ